MSIPKKGHDEALWRKWQGWGKLDVILNNDRNRFHGHLHPIQMASLPSRDYFALRTLVPPLSTQLPRPGGDDARAGIARRSHHNLPLSCNTTHQNWRSAVDPICKPRLIPGVLPTRMYK